MLSKGGVICNIPLLCFYIFAFRCYDALVKYCAGLEFFFSCNLLNRYVFTRDNVPSRVLVFFSCDLMNPYVFGSDNVLSRVLVFFLV